MPSSSSTSAAHSFDDEPVVGMRALVGEQRRPVLARLRHRLDRVVGDVRRLLEPVERGVHPVAQLVAVGRGTPSSSMITFIGRIAENSSTKSPPPFSCSGSRHSIAVARTNGSRSAIARGVNARLTSLRCTSCVGRVHEDHHGEHRRGVEHLDRGALGRAVQQRLLRRVEHVVRSATARRSRPSRCGSRARCRGASGRRGTGRRGTRARTGPAPSDDRFTRGCAR